VAEALTPLLLAAAVVLAAAGVMKLRDSDGVRAALRVLGLPAGRGTARGLGIGEIALGIWVAVAPTRAGCALLAAVYAAFAVVAVVLVRHRASCGCFGTDDAPASGFQSLLSAALAVVAALSVIALPHGAGWLLRQPAGTAFALAVGTAGVAYAIVMAYTLVPRAWSAWSAT
jgi:uncharacterized membrane protein YphA (DoxX/SURF4 family)